MKVVLHWINCALPYTAMWEFSEFILLFVRQLWSRKGNLRNNLLLFYSRSYIYLSLENKYLHCVDPRLLQEELCQNYLISKLCFFKLMQSNFKLDASTDFSVLNINCEVMNFTLYVSFKKILSPSFTTPSQITKLRW